MILCIISVVNLFLDFDCPIFFAELSKKIMKDFFSFWQKFRVIQYSAVRTNRVANSQHRSNRNSVSYADQWQPPKSNFRFQFVETGQKFKFKFKIKNIQGDSKVCTKLQGVIKGTNTWCFLMMVKNLGDDRGPLKKTIFLFRPLKEIGAKNH